MNLLSASNLEKSYNGETLFSGVSLSIEKGDKIGFIGINGAGKTTLFRILCGEENLDGGEIFVTKETKIGYLKQHALLGSDKSLYGEVEEVFEAVIKIENELKDLAYLIDKNPRDIDKLILRQAVLTAKFGEAKGYEYRSQISATLIGLGFTEDDFTRSVSTLSGGQKTRVMLAKILLSDCNLLLLDEPTNHLDINSVIWLESFLKTYKGAAVVISHDRYFLDRVTDFTYNLELKKLTVYKGNYTAFLTQKELETKTKTREYANKTKEIKRLEASAELLHSFNREKSVKRAESKEKQIDKLAATLEKVEKVNNTMTFNFSPLVDSGKEVLVAENISKEFDGKPLFSGVNLTLRRGERAFLLGQNGCGKTTLIKILLGLIPQNSGTKELGYHVETSYYEQTLSNICNKKDIISEVWDDFPKLNNQEIRDVLARFLFKADDIFKEIENLSGGEKARVSLLKILLKRANFLILDEPTNHLDIESREALENALKGYKGTILAVSHDRYFINKLASTIYDMDEKGLTKYVGSYDEFLLAKKPDKIETEQKILSVNAENYKNKKDALSQRRKTETAIKRIEEKIDFTEKLIDEKNQKMCSEEVASDYEKVLAYMAEIETLNTELEGALAEWEKLNLNLSELP